MSPRRTFHLNEVIADEGCRITVVVEVFGNARIKVRTLGRINMSSGFTNHGKALK